MMRDTASFILAMHVLLYVSVILDMPVLRQCVGFIYFTFLPGFIIFSALNIKTDSVAVNFSLWVSISIAFSMFVGLLVNTFYPLLGISNPLSTLSLMVTVSALTLLIFIFSQIRKIGTNPHAYSQLFNAKIDLSGTVLCVISISVLILSIIGALYHDAFLLVFAVGGIAAIFAASIFLYKHISSRYYPFALFVISLSLLLQTSLISSHIMGWDIFNEYYVYKTVQTAGYWASTGTVPYSDPVSNLNSVLSVTILPTVYSTVLNLNGELVFKIVFPFIFCFTPIFLFKAYETQCGKVIALLSTFFFIADPINFYGLESLSLAREMIAYLFLSAMVFCFVKKEMSLGTRRFLVLFFSAGLAVSHYSLAFLSAFLIFSAYLAMRIFGKKDALITFGLILCIFAITFSWYLYVATPPFNSLREAFYNVVSRLSEDFFAPKNRLDPGMAPLSPTAQATSIIGFIHKVVIYISEFFVVVGVIVLAIKPKEFNFNAWLRWVVIFAALILLTCVAIPNVAPLLNFTRFYRYVMIFLAPLFTLGGMYFLSFFRKILARTLTRPRFIFRGWRLYMLTIFLIVFFLFRSGFVNTLSGGLPYSYSLDFNRWIAESSGVRALEFMKIMGNVYNIYIPEQDLASLKWFSQSVGNNHTVYASYGIGVSTIIDYTNLTRQNIYYLTNETARTSESYIYLKALNTLPGIFNFPKGYFNLSDLRSPLSEYCQIYSNGASDVYFIP